VDTDAAGVVHPNALPGSDYAENAPAMIYEYAVAAVNGNGEGVKCAPVSTDPAGWAVWWPANQSEQFKRQSAFWLPPYVPAEQAPPARYPAPDTQPISLNDPAKKNIAMQLVNPPLEFRVYGDGYTIPPPNR
jgi:hypothetical protein